MKLREILTFGARPAPDWAYVTTPAPININDTVTIVGKGFFGITAVQFTGDDAVVFEAVSDSLITVLVPVGALNGPVTVVGEYGQAVTQSITIGDDATFGFRRTIVQPDDGSEFTVELPQEQSTDDYAVRAFLVKGDNMVMFELPLVGRSETEFPVITSAPLSDGDVVEFIVFLPS